MSTCSLLTPHRGICTKHAGKHLSSRGLDSGRGYLDMMWLAAYKQPPSSPSSWLAVDWTCVHIVTRAWSRYGSYKVQWETEFGMRQQAHRQCPPSPPTQSQAMGSQGEPLLDRSCLESSPLTRRWIFCSSLLASLSGHSLGDNETDPEDKVEDLLVISESRAAEAGLGTRLGPFPSMVPLESEWRAVVRRLLLSGIGMGKE